MFTLSVEAAVSKAGCKMIKRTYLDKEKLPTDKLNGLWDKNVPYAYFETNVRAWFHDGVSCIKFCQGLNLKSKLQRLSRLLGYLPPQ